MQYNNEYSADSIYTFANNINTEHGGTHLSGFKSAVTRTLNRYARDNRVVKDNDTLPDGSDYLEGLVAVISVKLPDPKFESQTKVKLSNTRSRVIVQTIVGRGPPHVPRGESGQLEVHHPKGGAGEGGSRSRTQGTRSHSPEVRPFERKPALASSPTARVEIHSRRSSTSWRATRQVARPRWVEFGNTRRSFPFAGRSSTSRRRASTRCSGTKRSRSIISALGTGIGHDDFDLSKLRYGKIIIMTDADVDGSHIRTLLLTFFFRQMPQLIEAGHVYIAQPPLYEMIPKRGGRKNSKYIQDEKAYEEEMVLLGSGTLVVTRDDPLTPDGAEPSPESQITGEALQVLCRAISRLEKIEKRMNARGIALQEYVSHESEEDPQAPDGDRSDQPEGRRTGAPLLLRSRAIAKSSSSVFAPNGTASSRPRPEEDLLEQRENADVVIHEVYESENIRRQCELVREHGFSPKVFRLTEREDPSGRLKYEPIARRSRGRGRASLRSLRHPKSCPRRR